MEEFVQYYPVMIDLRDKLCAVIGGGRVAARKVESLLEAGARVRVISPALCEELKAGEALGLFEHIDSEYHERFLDGVFLAIGATDNDEINRRIGLDASRRGLLVNIVDDAEHSNFIVPSVVRRGRLTIAISTGGASPAYARRLKEDIGSTYTAGHAAFLDIMAEVRAAVLAGIDDGEVRRRIFESLAEGPLLQAVLAEAWDDAVELLKRTVRQQSGRDLSQDMEESIERAVRSAAAMFAAGPSGASAGMPGGGAIVEDPGTEQR